MASSFFAGSATWIVAFILIGYSIAAFYSIYLMSLANGVYKGTIKIIDNGTNEDVLLLDAIRKALDYYKNFTYGVIVFNAIAVISLFLRVYTVNLRV